MFERFRTDPLYNTRAVVQRTDVPADTFRAWERRYGLPSPTRTPGNQRLYSERDIAMIAWLRDQTRGGLTISQAIALMQSETSRGEEAAMTDGRPAAQGGTADFQQALLDALIALNGAQATRVIEQALAILPVEDVCLKVMQPTLQEIGERWSRGELGISAEHFASSFVSARVGALFNMSMPETGRGPIVAACPRGETHEIGLLLTSLFLSRRGYQVIFLGGNMPEEDLVQTIRDHRPALVLLSASTMANAEELIRAVDELRNDPELVKMGRQAPQVGFGGRPFSLHPELRGRVEGLFLGSDAREAARAVDELFASLPA